MRDHVGLVLSGSKVPSVVVAANVAAAQRRISTQRPDHEWGGTPKPLPALIGMGSGLFKYSRVVGATTRRAWESLEGQDTIHLCNQDGCTHQATLPATLHCPCYAAVDVDRGAYGGFSACNVEFYLPAPVLHRGCVWCCLQLRRQGTGGLASTRQIQDRGVLTPLDPLRREALVGR